MKMNAVYIKTSATLTQLSVKTRLGHIHVHAKVASCRAILIPICVMVSTTLNSSLLQPLKSSLEFVQHPINIPSPQLRFHAQFNILAISGGPIFIQ